ncbi:hypothetical protein EYF80_002654 [Liparis tanakae]|uniref:Uncharacterized protein n=1 Tax=Liparis tanakae TaxID=230148 RepID=A0A4Z2J9K7_9TELE|nr:hypothetical protein EYF80_002654 [Liparis tanakae]
MDSSSIPQKAFITGMLDRDIMSVLITFCTQSSQLTWVKRLHVAVKKTDVHASHVDNVEQGCDDHAPHCQQHPDQNIDCKQQDLKENKILSVQNRDDDEEDGDQKAEEENHGLDDHACRGEIGVLGQSNFCQTRILKCVQDKKLPREGVRRYHQAPQFAQEHSKHRHGEALVLSMIQEVDRTVPSSHCGAESNVTSPGCSVLPPPCKGPISAEGYHHTGILGRERTPKQEHNMFGKQEGLLLSLGTPTTDLIVYPDPDKRPASYLLGISPSGEQQLCSPRSDKHLHNTLLHCRAEWMSSVGGGAHVAHTAPPGAAGLRGGWKDTKELRFTLSSELMQRERYSSAADCTRHRRQDSEELPFNPSFHGYHLAPVQDAGKPNEERSPVGLMPTVANIVPHHHSNRPGY